MGKLTTAIIMACIMAGCTGSTPEPRVTGADIIAAWKAAGLEAENVRPMTADDYGLVPYICKADATRFYIPSLGEDNGGRLYVCDSAADADKIAAVYEKIGEASAMLATHVLRAGDGRIVAQINGTLPDDKAAAYGAALVAAAGE